MTLPKTYFLEFLPRIQAVQVAISDHLEDQLLFCSNAIYCKKENPGDKELVPIVLWASPRLCVASYLVLRLVHGEAVHLRFAAKVSQSAFSAAIVEEKLAEGTETCALVVKCEFCHSCLTKPNYCFRRVLPLPSDAWSEFTGDVFCHAHGSSLTSPTALLPKEGDCLVSESSVLIRRSAVDDHITVMDKRTIEGKDSRIRIMCSRCLTSIGDVEGNDWSQTETTQAKSTSSTVFHLQRSQILLENSSSLENGQSHSLLSWRHAEANFARKLYAASKSKGLYRFIVQDGKKRNYILLWMLNVVSQVVYNSSPAENVYNQFLDIDGASPSPSSKCTSTALKLLYICTISESVSTDSSSMRSDSNVEPLELAARECLQLLLILSNNNRAIPPSQRVANGFKVGFLRISEHT